MSPTAVVNYVNKAVQDAFKRGMQANSEVSSNPVYQHGSAGLKDWRNQPADDVSIALQSTGGIGRTTFSDDFLATVYAKEQGFKL